MGRIWEEFGREKHEEIYCMTFFISPKTFLKSRRPGILDWAPRSLYEHKHWPYVVMEKFGGEF